MNIHNGGLRLAALALALALSLALALRSGAIVSYPNRFKVYK